MGNSKMCPFIHMVGCPGDTQDTCPTNTNSHCEIIAPKKRMVRVKAWAVGDMDGINSRYETPECGWRYAVFKTKKAARNNAECAFTVYPCTITIDAKYLREKS